jgi:hypothetical protein
MLEADSLQEEKYINLVIMKSTKKLKNSIATYSSSNDDNKWRLFSKAITGRTITSIKEIVFYQNFREEENKR